MLANMGVDHSGIGTVHGSVTRLVQSSLFVSRDVSTMDTTSSWPDPKCDIMNRNPDLVDIDYNFNFIFTLVFLHVDSTTLHTKNMLATI